MAKIPPLKRGVYQIPRVCLHTRLAILNDMVPLLWTVIKSTGTTYSSPILLTSTELSIQPPNLDQLQSVLWYRRISPLSTRPNQTLQNSILMTTSQVAGACSGAVTRPRRDPSTTTPGSLHHISSLRSFTLLSKRQCISILCHHWCDHTPTKVNP